MRITVFVLGCTLLAACSSASAPAPDLARPDLAIVPDQAGTKDAARADLGRDGPRAPAVWKPVAGAAPLRYWHTVTLLANGDLLVVGGGDAAGVRQAAAFRYLAATAEFVPAGTLALARFRHTASRLPDGRVLVVGGDTEASYSATTELYDPTKPAASAWSAGPDLLHAASQHTATVLADGRVLVAGGWENGLVSQPWLQLYDPKSNSWQVALAMLGEGRRGHTATPLADGKVLFAGGVDGGNTNPSYWTYRDSLEVYDPKSGTVKLLAGRMSMGRFAHSADLLADGRVLIVGGYCDIKCAPTAKHVDDLYDPATDTLTPVPHPGEFPSQHATARLADGRLLVIGGSLTDPTTVHAFQPTPPPGWDRLPGLAHGRISAEAIRLLDGTVLVVGGFVPGTDQMTPPERLFP